MNILKNLNVPIPKNEQGRLQILKQTKILDSNTDDEEYDRFTLLAARIFKVPICLLSIIDVSRQWFKSRVGLKSSQTHRDIAFCAYTILEESPDVMVVLDATKDPRFATNPLVIGPPFIRFYAGAAVIVNNVKIGSFCLIDDKPKSDFDAEQRRNLMEIGSIVSHMISLRRNKMLDTENDLAKLSMSIVYGLKYPLQELTNSTLQLSSSMDLISEWWETHRGKRGTAEELDGLVSRLEGSITGLQRSLARQSQLMESSLALSRSFVDFDKEDALPTAQQRMGFVFLEQADVPALLASLQSAVRQASPAVTFQLDLQPSARVFSTSPAQLTYPDVVSLLAFSVVFHLLRETPGTIGLSVGFRESLDKAANTASWVDQPHLQGHLELSFSASAAQQPPQRCRLNDSLAFNMECFDDLLRSVGGCYRVQGEGHLISFPCVVLLPDPAPVPVPRRANTRASGQLLKVLLLQEDPAQRRTLAAWLWAQGCAVVLASDGADALQHLTAFHGFDLALLDLSDSGAASCLRDFHLKTLSSSPDPQGSQRTVIVGTASSNYETHQLRDWFACGMHFFATPPATLHGLGLVLKAVQSHALDHSNAVIIASVVSIINSSKSCGLCYSA